MLRLTLPAAPEPTPDPAWQGAEGPPYLPTISVCFITPCRIKRGSHGRPRIPSLGLACIRPASLPLWIYLPRLA